MPREVQMQTTTVAGKPLNGEKTHPLSDHAWGVLEELLRGPMKRFLINPGVINRLDREGLIEPCEVVHAPPRGKLRKLSAIRITDAGRAKLKQEHQAHA
jgi:hypothetical protein